MAMQLPRPLGLQPAPGQAPPEQSLETRKMPAFLASMMQANSNQICTAKGDDVRKVSIEFLLQHRLRIPIFQRRYCWCEDQWEILFGDVEAIATGRKDVHPVGRLTCTIGDSADGRLNVIDGQQRNTTATLFLAAIRDSASTLEGDQAAELSARIDAMLFPDTEGLQAWLATRASTGAVVVDEGEALEFAALVPTYCDRAAYFSALLPARAAAECSGEWLRPAEAKRYFLSRLRDCDVGRLETISDAILRKLEWLFFPVDLTGAHGDGTEDVQMIYERLAIRDATFIAPNMKRKAEAANMGAADFIRNLMLGSFRTEEDAVNAYKTQWLPIERAASAAMALRQDGDVAVALNGMFVSFLAAQPEQPSGNVGIHGVPIGGQLYAHFRAWMVEACAKAESAVGNAAAADRVTLELLARLSAFATEHFNRPASSDSAAALRDLAEAKGFGKPATAGGARRMSAEPLDGQIAEGDEEEEEED